MSNNTGNSVIALLTGAVIGAGIGILFAPNKGTKTRGRIKDGIKDAKKQLKCKLESTKDGLRNKFSDTKDDLDGSYENLLSNMSYKTEDIISFLESKLADLKAQNAKLQK